MHTCKSFSARTREYAVLVRRRWGSYPQGLSMAGSLSWDFCSLAGTFDCWESVLLSLCPAVVDWLVCSERTAQIDLFMYYSACMSTSLHMCVYVLCLNAFTDYIHNIMCYVPTKTYLHDSAAGSLPFAHTVMQYSPVTICFLHLQWLRQYEHMWTNTRRCHLPLLMTSMYHSIMRQECLSSSHSLHQKPQLPLSHMWCLVWARHQNQHLWWIWV